MKKTTKKLLSLLLVLSMLFSMLPASTFALGEDNSGEGGEIEGPGELQAITKVEAKWNPSTNKVEVTIEHNSGTSLQSAVVIAIVPNFALIPSQTHPVGPTVAGNASFLDPGTVAGKLASEFAGVGIPTGIYEHADTPYVAETYTWDIAMDFSAFDTPVYALNSSEPINPATDGYPYTVAVRYAAVSTGGMMSTTVQAGKPLTPAELSASPETAYIEYTGGNVVTLNGVTYTESSVAIEVTNIKDDDANATILSVTATGDLVVKQDGIPLDDKFYIDAQDILGVEIGKIGTGASSGTMTIYSEDNWRSPRSLSGTITITYLTGDGTKTATLEIPYTIVDAGAVMLTGSIPAITAPLGVPTSKTGYVQASAPGEIVITNISNDTNKGEIVSGLSVGDVVTAATANIEYQTAALQNAGNLTDDIVIDYIYFDYNEIQNGLGLLRLPANLEDMKAAILEDFGSWDEPDGFYDQVGGAFVGDFDSLYDWALYLRDGATVLSDASPLTIPVTINVLAGDDPQLTLVPPTPSWTMTAGDTASLTATQSGAVTIREINNVAADITGATLRNGTADISASAVGSYSNSIAASGDGTIPISLNANDFNSLTPGIYTFYLDVTYRTAGDAGATVKTFSQALTITIAAAAPTTFDPVVTITGTTVTSVVLRPNANDDGVTTGDVALADGDANGTWTMDDVANGTYRVVINGKELTAAPGSVSNVLLSDTDTAKTIAFYQVTAGTNPTELGLGAAVTNSYVTENAYFLSGEEATVTHTDTNVYYDFANWSSAPTGVTGTANPVTHAVTENITITANFTATGWQGTVNTYIDGAAADISGGVKLINTGDSSDTHTLSVGAAGVYTTGANALKDGATYRVEIGTTNLSASPYLVASVTKGAPSTSVYAYNVKLGTPTNGGISGGGLSTSDTLLFQNHSISLTATPAANYALSSWSATGAASGWTRNTSPTDFTVPASGSGAITINATFNQTHFLATVNLLKNGDAWAGQTVGLWQGSSQVGSDLADATGVYTGYFANGTYDIYVGSVKTNVTITISSANNSADVKYFDVSVDPSLENGTISGSPTLPATLLAETKINLTATPDSDYAFGSWSATGGGTFSGNEFTVPSSGSSAIVISATFNPTAFPATVKLTRNGSAAAWSEQTVALKPGAGPDISLPETGTSGTYTANVAAGTYDILVNGKDTDANLTVTTSGTATLNFYEVSLAGPQTGQAGAGSISATNNFALSGTAYLAGAAVSITGVTAEPGYRFEAWGASDTAGSFSPSNAADTDYTLPDAAHTGAITLRPSFIKQHLVTLASADSVSATFKYTIESGTEQNYTDPFYVDDLLSVTVTVTLNATTTHEFKEWTATPAHSLTGVTGTSATTIPTEDITLTATFYVLPAIAYTTAGMDTYDVGAGATANTTLPAIEYTVNDGSFKEITISKDGYTKTLSTDDYTVSSSTYTLKHDTLAAIVADASGGTGAYTVTFVDNHATNRNYDKTLTLTLFNTKATLKSVTIVGEASATSLKLDEKAQYSAHTDNTSGGPNILPGDLSWTWYYSATEPTAGAYTDVAAAQAAIPDGATAFGSGNGLGATYNNIAVADAQKGKYIFAVVEAVGGGQGAVITNSIPVDFDAKITVKVDDGPITDDTGYTVNLYASTDGGFITQINTVWQTDGFVTENAALTHGATYVVRVTHEDGTFGSWATVAGETITVTDQAGEINFYTVKYTSAVTIDNPVGSNTAFDDVLAAGSHMLSAAAVVGAHIVTNNQIVLEGTAVEFTISGGVAIWPHTTFDYTPSWAAATDGTANDSKATLTVNNKQTDPVVATLTRKTYAVTVGLHIDSTADNSLDSVTFTRTSGSETETFTAGTLNTLDKGNGITINLPKSDSHPYTVSAAAVSGGNDYAVVDLYFNDSPQASGTPITSKDGFAVSTTEHTMYAKTEGASYTLALHDDSVSSGNYAVSDGRSVFSGVYGTAGTATAYTLRIVNTGNRPLTNVTINATNVVSAGPASPAAADIVTLAGTVADIAVGAYADVTLTAVWNDPYTALNAGNHVVTYTVSADDVASADEKTYAATVTVAKAKITAAAITDIDQPETGTGLDTPFTHDGDEKHYTAAIAWNPTTTPAAPGTEYTVTVTLTANDNYEFDIGTPANFTINSEACNVSGGGATATLTYTFLPTAPTMTLAFAGKSIDSTNGSATGTASATGVTVMPAGYTSTVYFALIQTSDLTQTIRDAITAGGIVGEDISLGNWKYGNHANSVDFTNLDSYTNYTVFAVVQSVNGGTTITSAVMEASGFTPYALKVTSAGADDGNQAGIGGTMTSIGTASVYLAIMPPAVSITLTTTTATGWQFKEWDGDGSFAGNTYTLSAAAQAGTAVDEVTAYFEGEPLSIIPPATINRTYADEETSGNGFLGLPANGGTLVSGGTGSYTYEEKTGAGAGTTTLADLGLGIGSDGLVGRLKAVGDGQTVVLTVTDADTGVTADVTLTFNVAKYPLTGTPVLAAKTYYENDATSDSDLSGTVTAPYHNGSDWDVVTVPGAWTFTPAATITGTKDYPVTFTPSSPHSDVYLAVTGQKVNINSVGKNYGLTVNTERNAETVVYGAWDTPTVLNVDLINTGNQPADFTDTDAFKLTGTHAGMFEFVATPPTTLADGATANIRVRLKNGQTPAVDAYTATLVITDGNPGHTGGTKTQTVYFTLTVTPAAIASAAVSNITPPVLGDVPKMTVRDGDIDITDGYTNAATDDYVEADPPFVYTASNVVWGGTLKDGKFAPGTVYTAMVTLTANGNYSFDEDGGSNYTLNEKGSGDAEVMVSRSGDGAGNTITLTYTFPATAPGNLTVTAQAANASASPSFTESYGTFDISVDTGLPVDIYYIVSNTPLTFVDAEAFITSHTAGIGTDKIAVDKVTKTPAAGKATLSGTVAAALVDPSTEYFVYALAAPQGTDIYTAVGDSSFTTWHKVAVEVDDADNGAIQLPTQSLAYVVPGGSLPIQVEAYSGYNFVNWTATGEGTFVDDDAPSTTFAPTASGTVIANFGGVAVLEIEGEARTSQVPYGYANGFPIFTGAGGISDALVKNTGGANTVGNLMLVVVEADPTIGGASYFTDPTNRSANAEIAVYTSPAALNKNAEAPFQVVLNEGLGNASTEESHTYYLVAYDAGNEDNYIVVQLDIVVAPKPTLTPSFKYYDLNKRVTNTDWVMTVTHGDFKNLVSLGDGAEITLNVSNSGGDLVFSDNNPTTVSDTTTSTLTITEAIMTSKLKGAHTAGQNLNLTATYEDGSSNHAERTIQLRFVDTTPELDGVTVAYTGSIGLGTTLTAHVTYTPKNAQGVPGTPGQALPAGDYSKVAFEWFKVPKDEGTASTNKVSLGTGRTYTLANDDDSYDIFVVATAIAYDVDSTNGGYYLGTETSDITGADEYTVTILRSPEAGGSAPLHNSVQKVDITPAEAVALTATAVTEYHFTGWTVESGGGVFTATNAGAGGGTATFADTTAYFWPSKSTTVTANFDLLPTLVIDTGSYNIGAANTGKAGVTLTYEKNAGSLSAIVITDKNSGIIATLGDGDVTLAGGASTFGDSGTYTISHDWLNANLDDFATEGPYTITFKDVKDTGTGSAYNTAEGLAITLTNLELPDYFIMDNTGGLLLDDFDSTATASMPNTGLIVGADIKAIAKAVAAPTATYAWYCGNSGLTLAAVKALSPTDSDVQWDDLTNAFLSANVGKWIYLVVTGTGDYAGSEKLVSLGPIPAPQYTVTAKTLGGGTVKAGASAESGSTADATSAASGVALNSSVALVAKPNTGYKFGGWTRVTADAGGFGSTAGGETSGSTTAYFFPTADATVEASFVPGTISMTDGALGDVYYMTSGSMAVNPSTPLFAGTVAATTELTTTVTYRAAIAGDMYSSSALASGDIDWPAWLEINPSTGALSMKNDASKWVNDKNVSATAEPEYTIYITAVDSNTGEKATGKYTIDLKKGVLTAGGTFDYNTTPTAPVDGNLILIDQLDYTAGTVSNAKGEPLTQTISIDTVAGRWVVSSANLRFSGEVGGTLVGGKYKKEYTFIFKPYATGGAVNYEELEIQVEIASDPASASVGVYDKWDDATDAADAYEGDTATATDSRTIELDYLDAVGGPYAVWVKNTGTQALHHARITAVPGAESSFTLTVTESGMEEGGAGVALAAGASVEGFTLTLNEDVVASVGMYIVTVTVEAWDGTDGSVGTGTKVTAEYTLTIDIDALEIGGIDVIGLPEPTVGDPVLETDRPKVPKNDSTGWYVEVTDGTTTQKVYLEDDLAPAVRNGGTGLDDNDNAPYTVEIVWKESDGSGGWTDTADTEFKQGKEYQAVVVITPDDNYALTGGVDDYSLNGQTHGDTAPDTAVTIGTGDVTIKQDFDALPLNEIKLDVGISAQAQKVPTAGATIAHYTATIPTAYAGLYDFASPGATDGWYVWNDTAWVAATGTFEAGKKYMLQATVEAVNSNAFATVMADIGFYWNDVAIAGDKKLSSGNLDNDVNSVLDNGTTYTMAYVLMLESYGIGVRDKLNNPAEPHAASDEREETVNYHSAAANYPFFVKNTGTETLTGVKVSAVALTIDSADATGQWANYFTINYGSTGLDLSDTGIELSAAAAELELVINPAKQAGGTLKLDAGTYELTVTVEGTKAGGGTVSAAYTLKLTVEPIQVGDFVIDLPAPKAGETPPVSGTLALTHNAAGKLVVTVDGTDVVVVDDDVATRRPGLLTDDNGRIPYTVTVEWEVSTNGTTYTAMAAGGSFETGKYYRPKVTLNTAGNGGNYIVDTTDAMIRVEGETPGVDGVNEDGPDKVILTGKAVGPMDIMNVYMVVTAPVVGAAPSIADPLPRTADAGLYEAVAVDHADAAPGVNVLWQKKDAGGNWVNMDPATDKFEYSKQYKVIMTVDEAGATPFAPFADMNFHINNAALSKTTGDNRVVDNSGTFTMSYVFTMGDAPVTPPPGGGGLPTTNLKVTYVVPEFGTTTDATQETVAKGKYPVAVPNVTVQKGYLFLGWSLLPDDKTDVDDPELVDPTKVVIEKDTTFYAIYQYTEREHERYIKGYPDGTFGPANNISRSEVAAIIARAILGGFSESTDYGNGGYTDVPDAHWARSAIAYCTMHGVFVGVGNNEFQPDRSITREEFALVFARLAGILEAKDMPFGDASDISVWALSGVYTAFEKGWIEGYSDGTFLPAQPIRRDEAVKIVNRYLNRGVDHEGIEDILAELKQWPDVETTHWAFYEVLEASNDHTMFYRNGTTPPETWYRAFIETPSWQ